MYTQTLCAWYVLCMYNESLHTYLVQSVFQLVLEVGERNIVCVQFYIPWL